MIRPTYEQTSDVLDYRPETGELVWKKRVQSQVPAGRVAGTPSSDRYLTVSVLGRKHPAHRLAWLLFYGEWPNGWIDHINGIRTDNRITNLRLATNTENQHSVFRPSRNSTTGVRGVSRSHNRFTAQIRVGKKQIRLGSFLTIDEAQAAYLAAKEILHPASAVAKPHLVNHPAQEADK